MKFGSLFTGIGGLDLGFESAGFECAWQVEWDPFCNHILEQRWPGVPRHEDITKVDFRSIESVDILIGGFPCQPVSFAGRGLAQDDDRWLWPEFERAIAEVEPRYVVAENVPGLVNRGLIDVLRSLAWLGYDAEWSHLSAEQVGAHHLRERVIIVAHKVANPDDEGSQGHGGLRLVGDRAGQFIAGTRRRSEQGIWKSEPNVGRVAHGVPKRVDRLRALGNAVVPQVAEAVAWSIADHILRTEQPHRG